MQLSPDNKIINGLWISPDGKPLSNLERLCIYSFCANGHDFHLWTYGDLPNIPQDTSPGKAEARNANEILQAKNIFRLRDSFAPFSDRFSWELMAQVGGWYVDMDMVCVRPHQFDEEVVFAEAFANYVNVALLKFPKGHWLAEKMAFACANPNRIVPWDTPKRKLKKLYRPLIFWRDKHRRQCWGESGGPAGFGLALRHFGMMQDAKPSWVSEIIGRANIKFLIDGELHKIGVLSKLLEHAYSVHFYSNSFRSNDWDKNGEFHPHSPYEILKCRYLPELKE